MLKKYRNINNQTQINLIKEIFRKERFKQT